MVIICALVALFGFYVVCYGAGAKKPIGLGLSGKSYWQKFCM